jgi:hypothetical protein
MKAMARDHERDMAERAGDRHGELTNCRSGHVDGGVDRKDRAAAAVVRHLVEPAFDDHRRACKAEAGKGAQHDPADILNPKQVKQDGDRTDRCHDRIGAYVPDAFHQHRHGDRAGNEPHRPAGADEAQRRQREPLLGTAHREQQALQPTSEHQECRADEQGINLEGGGHGAFCGYRGLRRLP